MFRRFALSLAICLLAAPLTAGVVFEIETTDHAQSSEPYLHEATAEGKNIKMEIRDAKSGDGEAIFRGDRRQMVVVDHREKSYMVVDQEMIQGVSAQLQTVGTQIQEALKNVPEDQRAMIEKMMRENMPSQAPTAQGPRSTVKKTGERAEHNGYPCVRYDLMQGDRKVKEYWVTDWSNVDGGENLEDVYLEMSQFFRELLASFESSMAGSGLPTGGGFLGDNPFESFEELDGFPVVTRKFDEDGSLESESVLRSSRRMALDPDAFEPPSGYKRRTMPGF